ncbi:hypothetical protein ACLB1Q_23270 [Escherichia coli]
MTWCSRWIIKKNAQNPYHKVSGGSYEYFEGMGLPELIGRK